MREPAASERAEGTLPWSLIINGERRELRIDPRMTLLDALREGFGLTGAKPGCQQGACGACTVLLDGERVLSCLTLALQVQDAEVQTIEGLAPGGPDAPLHPMQEAFLRHDALQCGYCTPGQVLSAVACVREGLTSDANEVAEAMSGNLCRCGAYLGIRGAILEVAREGADDPDKTEEATP